jgi:hypothetical protein
MSDDGTCPNCGNSKYKKFKTCDNCGYTQPELKELPSAYLIFCGLCGCNYLTDSGMCPSHGGGKHITVKK